MKLAKKMQSDNSYFCFYYVVVQLFDLSDFMEFFDLVDYSCKLFCKRIKLTLSIVETVTNDLMDIIHIKM